MAIAVGGGTPSDPTPAAGQGGRVATPVRVHSLDGLRGLAALVVVIHHCLLTYPALSAAYVADGRTSVGASAWLVYSPVHLLWAGGEAVLVFFVVSGFVLTLPVLRARQFAWRAYYPSRLVRLYLPVAASLATAVALTVIVPRTVDAASSGWERLHVEPVTPLSVIEDVFLVFGVSYLNSPLWSLRWEVLFSLALPLCVWFAVVTRRLWWLVLVLAVAAPVAAELLGQDLLRYPPLFMIGCVLAVAADRLGRAADVIARRGRWGWWLLAVLAALGITAAWTIGPSPARGLELAVPAVVSASAGLVVFLAAYWSTFAHLLSTPYFQALGIGSFSLYLVHEPIIVSFAFGLPSGLNWLTLVLGVPVSLGSAYLFYRVVESPTHRLSQRIRRALTPTRPR